jgi:hypothetical protein
MIDVGKDHVGASRPGCAPHSPPPVPWSAGDFLAFRFGRVSVAGHALPSILTRKSWPPHLPMREP